MGLAAHGLRCCGLAPLAKASTINGGGMMHPLLVLALVSPATWDAWRWYCGRVASAPEEAAALVLTIIFLGFVGVSRQSRREPPQPLPLLPIAGLLALLAATHSLLPPIVSAAVALALTL